MPPGLQNQCWAFEASWVGSIPTCLRQKQDLQENLFLQTIYKEAWIHKEAIDKGENGPWEIYNFC